MYTDLMTDASYDLHEVTINTSIGDDQITFAIGNDGTIVVCQLDAEVSEIDDVIAEFARALVGIGFSAELVIECLPGTLGER